MNGSKIWCVYHLNTRHTVTLNTFYTHFTHFYFISPLCHTVAGILRAFGTCWGSLGLQGDAGTRKNVEKCDEMNNRLHGFVQARGPSIHTHTHYPRRRMSPLYLITHILHTLTYTNNPVILNTPLKFIDLVGFRHKGKVKAVIKG